MLVHRLASRSVAAVTSAAMLALSLSPASALTLAGPPLGHSVASAQVDKVWWRRGWGWGPAALVGGLAAGAIVGSAIAGPAYYGPGYYGPGYYGPCWRRAVDPYGRWYWARAC